MDWLNRDDELDEDEAMQAFDALIEYIRENVDEDACSVRVLDPERINHVRLCEAVLQHFSFGKELFIECEMHKPIDSSAYITLEGKSITMGDTRWLARVGSLANNMEVYPLAAGGVRMTFMFYGITKEVE